MSIAIEVKQGDITQSKTEAIVNAANNHLWMGSGVAGAIKRAGGEEIEKEAVSKGPIEVGQAVETTAGRLPYRYIIHAAGMGQDLRTNERIVHEVTKNCILLADRLKLKSISFPAIGTGVGGFPLDKCAEIMIDAVKSLETELSSLQTVEFILFDNDSFNAFKTVLGNN